MIALLNMVSGYVTSYISRLGYGGLALFMTLESFNLPIPSEIIQPFGGYLVSAGRLTFWGAVLSGTLGGTVGSLASYYLGRYLMGCRFLFWISPSKVKRLNSWFDRYGESTVFFCRLIPIVRTFISLPAGAARMNIPRFLVYSFLGSLLWSILLTYFGYMLGENWDILKIYFHQTDLVLMIVLVVLAVTYLMRHYMQSRNQPGN